MNIISFVDCPEDINYEYLPSSENVPSLDLFFPKALPTVQDLEALSGGPIIERLYSDRYDETRRNKRHIPIVSGGIKLLANIIPNLLKISRHTFNTLNAKTKLKIDALSKQLALKRQLKSLQHFSNFQVVPNWYPKPLYYRKKFASLLNNKYSKHYSSSTYLPKNFIKPYQQPYLKWQKTTSLKPYQRLLKRPKTLSSTFLEKLQKLNRNKRSSIIDGSELSLPFFRVKEIHDNLIDNKDEDNDYLVGQKYVTTPSKTKTHELLKPFNFEQLIPQSPIFYFLNAPLRLLHHIRQLSRQIVPVLSSVPKVLGNSRRFLRDMSNNFQNNAIDIASNLMGDFDIFPNKPKRFRRNINSSSYPYEPEYSLVFDTRDKIRNKRYILKVVDEGEVEEFLREKLGNLVNYEPNEKLQQNQENSSKKKYVLEKLQSKLILDNNGKPFVEIDGIKRPLFLKNKSLLKNSKYTDNKESEENVKDKISSLIKKAKERIDMKDDSLLLQQQEVPIQVIKERTSAILTEIQDLINMDFTKYSIIHNNLWKLQNFKEELVKYWKKLLIDNKSNNISSKIRILDDLREMQMLRDKSVEDIIAILSNGNSFMTKKLIKMLIRLQKLQCLIAKVVEKFEDKLEMSTDLDCKEEIKFVDFLSDLNFINNSKNEFELQLKSDRDIALQTEMTTLDGLRKLLEDNPNSPKIYEEARLLWEIKNISKLLKNTMTEMNDKVSKNLKIRKELKILFDLLKQLEVCENKQKNLLDSLALFQNSPKLDEQGQENVEVKLKAPLKKKPTLLQLIAQRKANKKSLPQKNFLHKK